MGLTLFSSFSTSLLLLSSLFKVTKRKGNQIESQNDGQIGLPKKVAISRLSR